MKIALLALAFGSTAFAAEMFPFQLPWDDASESATNISWLNDKPAGRDGFVQVKDGHLFAGEKRLRIFGVNVCFAGNFPSHEDAPKIAARMAKFGINCVRFHHMDMFSAPAGIFAKDGRTLDPGQLDKLDYFIAELKKNGIYADLNLHVSRTYPDRPKSEKKGNPQFDKGVDNYHAPMIALQKDYARDLLTHVNKYTGKTYADEPAVALVEINNENALGFQWFAGELENLPQPYADDLSTQWTAWLVKKYGALEKTAWSEGARKAGAELLDVAVQRKGDTPVAPSADRRSPDDSKRDPGADAKGAAAAALGDKSVALPITWSFENHGAAKTKGVEKDGAITFTVENTGAEPWHAQFSAAPLKVTKDTPYAVAFRVKAPKDMKLTVNLMQAHEPWKVLGSAQVSAGTDWRDVRAVIRAGEADDNARLTITGMGQTAGTFEFEKFSLRAAEVRGAPVIEGKNARYLRKAELPSYTQAAQRDWQEFIWDTEIAYWNGMRDFLKKELGVKAPIVGTQGFWSAGHVQAGMDVIDSHAYWQHPHFEGGDWNPERWTIKNIPMSGAKDGGTLPGLAAQRVAGKPFICTEYNHSAPNTYGAETAPLLCAFAALQDWDGVFLFAYSHNDKWQQEHFDGFFDIARHPVKMATLPGAVLSFRRGDVRAAFSAKHTHFAQQQLAPLALKSGPGFASHSSRDLRQMQGFEAYRYYHSISTDAAQDRDTVAVKLNGPSAMRWNIEAANATVDDRISALSEPQDRRSHFFIGRAKHGEPVELGDVIFNSGTTPQNWACYQFTVLDRDEKADFSNAKRILITATGDIENTGMGWKNAEKTSVGRDWGKAPVLIEGPAAKIALPGGGKFKAWALDERGQRRVEIPVTDGTLEIGPQHRTLWYEVERE